jgi:hypothetical protein
MISEPAKSTAARRVPQAISGILAKGATPQRRFLLAPEGRVLQGFWRRYPAWQWTRDYRRDLPC